MANLLNPSMYQMTQSFIVAFFFLMLIFSPQSKQRDHSVHEVECLIVRLLFSLCSYKGLNGW